MQDHGMDRPREVTGQEKQMDNKTWGLYFASLLNVNRLNLAGAKSEQTLETQRKIPCSVR